MQKYLYIPKKLNELQYKKTREHQKILLILGVLLPGNAQKRLCYICFHRMVTDPENQQLFEI